MKDFYLADNFVQSEGGKQKSSPDFCKNINLPIVLNKSVFWIKSTAHTWVQALCHFSLTQYQCFKNKKIPIFYTLK